MSLDLDHLTTLARAATGWENVQLGLVLIGRIRELEAWCERLDGLINKDGD